jgi:hypothetical protein
MKSETLTNQVCEVNGSRDGGTKCLCPLDFYIGQLSFYFGQNLATSSKEQEAWSGIQFPSHVTLQCCHCSFPIHLVCHFDEMYAGLVLGVTSRPSFDEGLHQASRLLQEIYMVGPAGGSRTMLCILARVSHAALCVNVCYKVTNR